MSARSCIARSRDSVPLGTKELEMDESFLTQGRQDPEPGFARGLRERLRSVEAADAEPARRPRWQPALAGAFAMAALVASFSLPAVRVAAQNLLDLFRVREFAVVQV